MQMVGIMAKACILLQGLGMNISGSPEENSASHQVRPFTKATIALWIVAFSVFPAVLLSQPVAFPGAEGAGRFASGGRGGRVYEVTNLDDSGPGSLRDAVQATGPRTVVFRVSGTIKLLSALVIRHDSITIAGQTAPGDGICLRNFTFRVSASNVIIRYIRSRLGDSTRDADDAFSGNGLPIYRNIIVDHCSSSWAIDENSSFYDLGQFTMQWCFITESLYHSYHPKGNHGYGGMWGGWHASFHHNILAHNSSRNPRFNGSRYTGQPDSEVVDFRNNVIYNWGFNSGYGGEAGNQNIISNYYKYGPGTYGSVRNRIVEPYDTAGNWYISGNFIYGDTAVTSNNALGIQGTYALAQRAKLRPVPFSADSVTTQSPQDAYDSVLVGGGANLPRRDAVDTRIVNEVRTGTATYGGLWGVGKGIIDTQDSLGGWPQLNALPPPVDSDHDGIPDEWESANGLDPNDSTDAALITGDGYSNLEHYLNALVVTLLTGVKDYPPTIAEKFDLKANYPNPFNPATTITYALPVRTHVRVEIFTILGARVATLVDRVEGPGSYRVVFDGSGMSSGVYFCRMHTDRYSQIRKMVLLK
ncbi:MAG TPA: T9SS type A sorting domain-containing protein [Bacteroidota bacterium]|nr:T9SS type A sorting domain-containing protein [Bacteroidota bacterium]